MSLLVPASICVANEYLSKTKLGMKETINSPARMPRQNLAEEKRKQIVHLMQREREREALELITFKHIVVLWALRP